MRVSHYKRICRKTYICGFHSTEVKITAANDKEEKEEEEEGGGGGGRAGGEEEEEKERNHPVRELH